MSAYRFWEVVCDFRDSLGRECGTAAEGPNSHLRAAREYAAAHGWVRGPNDSDYCPRHAKHGAAGVVTTRTRDAGSSRATRMFPGVGDSPGTLPQGDPIGGGGV